MRNRIKIGIITMLIMYQAERQNYWKKITSPMPKLRESAIGFSIGNKGYFGSGYGDSNKILKDFSQ